MDIYKILSSLDHNTHHLKRYYKFVKSRIHYPSEYSERHHICPKSLFPMYASFTKNKWNWIRVTAREHFIMHKMLCKVYPDCAKLAFALFSMCNQRSPSQSRDYKVTSREYNVIKAINAKKMSELKSGIKISAEHRNKLVEQRNTPYSKIMNSYNQLPLVTKEKYNTLEKLINAVLNEYESSWRLPSVIAGRIDVSVEAVKNVLRYKQLQFEMNQSVTKVFLNYGHLFSSYTHYVESVLFYGRQNFSAFQAAKMLNVNEYGVAKIFQQNGIVVDIKKTGPKPKK